jgi:hypothetical protein
MALSPLLRRRVVLFAANDGLNLDQWRTGSSAVTGRAPYKHPATEFYDRRKRSKGARSAPCYIDFADLLWC